MVKPLNGALTEVMIEAVARLCDNEEEEEPGASLASATAM